MLLHPRCSVRIPPSQGAAESPTYTAIVFKPIILPRISGGNAEITIAILEPTIIALPIPWRNLEITSMVPEKEREHKNVATTKNRLPHSSIFLRPIISASFPKGTSMVAEDNRNAMAIQLSDTAFMDNSLPMEGSAILTADPMKGLKKEDSMITASKIPRFTFSAEPDLFMAAKL